MPSLPVIVDTNFLLLPFQFRLDVLEELEYLVERSHHFVLSSRTFAELKNIAAKKGKGGMGGRLALKMVEVHKERFEIIENKMPVDDWIVAYASENHAVVCTNDAELRRRLRAKKVRVVSFKGKGVLGFV
jgi:rRNA-processing protein FCF1